MYETILFPTDGSDHAATVADHAIDIATTRDAAVHVMSVVDDRAFLVLDDERVARFVAISRRVHRKQLAMQHTEPVSEDCRSRRPSILAIRRSVSSSTPTRTISI